MSTRATARLARTEADAAALEASAAQGSFVTTTTNGVAQPNTQTPAVTTKTVLGTTTGAGQTVVNSVPIPVHHSAMLEISIEGRVTVAGTAAVDETFMYKNFVSVNNPGPAPGTVTATPQIAPASGPVADAWTANLASPADITVTLAPGAGTGLIAVVVTEVGAQGTIDWIVSITTRLN
jgi:hypothetical protein